MVDTLYHTLYTTNTFPLPEQDSSLVAPPSSPSLWVCHAPTHAVSSSSSSFPHPHRPRTQRTRLAPHCATIITAGVSVAGSIIFEFITSLPSSSTQSMNKTCPSLRRHPHHWCGSVAGSIVFKFVTSSPLSSTHSTNKTPLIATPSSPPVSVCRRQHHL